MKYFLVILITALTVATAANAGFVKGNGETQFDGQKMPKDPETTHPSLTKRKVPNATAATASAGANAWAPHTKGRLDFDCSPNCD